MGGAQARWLENVVVKDQPKAARFAKRGNWQMNSSELLMRHGRLLMKVGVVLLLFLSFEGFAIEGLAAPQLGLSAHKLAGLESVLLLALGLAWPTLRLSAAASRAAFWLLIYSALSILAAYVFGALWGAGAETMRLAAAGARGTQVQETTIMVLAYSSAPTGLVAFALILWGLRDRARGEVL